jgi:stage II sporulation protein R
MVKRFSIRPYMYIAFAIIVLLASWESNRASAALVEQTIPQESIRLRILANSDAPREQWIKREIRDAVNARIAGWVQGPQEIEEARRQINSRLPELNDLVGKMLSANGFDYGYNVELGSVPFPTKMYGDKVYPAGDYEALLITLGEGKGQNWWCVLFPPLCFVDAASGEAIASTSDVAAVQTGGKAEVRFFLWDLLKQWFGLG